MLPLVFTTLYILASTASAQSTPVDVGGACGGGFMANAGGPQCKPGLVCMPGQISDGPGTCQPSDSTTGAGAVAPGLPQTPMSLEGGECGGALMCSAGLKCVFPETGGVSTGTCRQSGVPEDSVGSSSPGASPILLQVTETSTAQISAGFAAASTASSGMSSTTAPAVTMASVPVVASAGTFAKAAGTGTKSAGATAAATGTIKASGAWASQASILVIALLSLVF
ncbi:hypothetical protein BJ741DRAFT_594844 [Chytriomyces cf. hyalinus JEL632]|nr:hypothetical protein BJ741DRAFT_594844 [Chytriomyces cf. hyalinus JEL632]